MREDTTISKDKRWVRLSRGGGAEILLAKAQGAQQEAAIGNQAGGSVFLFLQTEDFWCDYHAFRHKGVFFEEEPRQEPYGLVAVFQDLYGNRWDLIQS